MKSRGILFSAPMVRAILEGRKTQTRRIITNVDVANCCTHQCGGKSEAVLTRGPYGVAKDQLWVRETWAPLPGGPCTKENGVVYRADQHPDNWLWKPSIYMPRWASRITLEIESVRVERLRDITEDDAIAEGIEERTIELSKGVTTKPCRMAYSLLWESIHGTDSWDAIPWVWVIQFRRVKP